MKYFVTGATGFIGGRVARQLLAAGHEVITLARTPSRAQALEALGVKVHAGDITDKESLRTPMRGVDGVFHIAAWYKVGARDKSQAETINVGGTRNVLLMMKELGIPKGVYTSTLTVFSDTRGQMVDESYQYTGTSFLSEYDRTKWKAHYEVALPMMQAGLPLVIVQPGLVYGPGDTSIVHEGWVNYLRNCPFYPLARRIAGGMSMTLRTDISWQWSRAKPEKAISLVGQSTALLKRSTWQNRSAGCEPRACIQLPG